MNVVQDTGAEGLGTAPAATLMSMWLLILTLMLVGCAIAYANRVTILAKVLGQSETRINRHLRRTPR